MEACLDSLHSFAPASADDGLCSWHAEADGLNWAAEGAGSCAGASDSADAALFACGGDARKFAPHETTFRSCFFAGEVKSRDLRRQRENSLRGASEDSSESAKLELILALLSAHSTVFLVSSSLVTRALVMRWRICSTVGKSSSSSVKCCLGKAKSEQKVIASTEASRFCTVLSSSGTSPKYDTASCSSRITSSSCVRTSCCFSHRRTLRFLVSSVW
mmetsp:Transcript_47302/g.117115  ORF Transcript_47302/g.117115 Transcript_47302/m.117115 type:complete len:217 (+) Transcript_47302:403-1053(+)